jgi:hypothetical protein
MDAAGMTKHQALKRAGWNSRGQKCGVFFFTCVPCYCFSLSYIESKAEKDMVADVLGQTARDKGCRVFGSIVFV